jgi:hypothetical protein
LAAQPLAQVGDLEVLAKMVCELAGEQHTAMLAALTDGNEGGFAADQGAQSFAGFGLSRVPIARPHLLGRFHGLGRPMRSLHLGDPHRKLQATLANSHGLRLQQAKGVRVALFSPDTRDFVQDIVQPVPLTRELVLSRPQFCEPFHLCNSNPHVLVLFYAVAR